MFEDNWQIFMDRMPKPKPLAKAMTNTEGNKALQ